MHNNAPLIAELCYCILANNMSFGYELIADTLYPSSNLCSSYIQFCSYTH
ncbi:hypothetical protein GBAR_LOCUS3691 [Geodia barretti]|uniref:Uncharacterized protein n=1 Tax=Geodia barretti TaxID=519541 RepID=A0AA35W1V4_GEOBA|nr:hypothetical protein GBAR_LOCUS3691 [Geodia barretti]